MYDFDPIIGTDIIHAMGIDPTHLANASVYNRVKGVIEYFKNSPTYRQDVLRVLSKKQGKPLDTAWTYVQLQREKQKQIKRLDPKDFDKDVAQEIVNGYLTKEKRERVKKDIDSRMVEDIIGRNKVDVYSSAIREIDKLDKELSKFN